LHRGMKSVRYKAIGTIRTPFRDLSGMPIQPIGAREQVGTIELEPRYQPGLNDLKGFSHIILLYDFHRSKGFDLKVTPFLDSRPRGLFSTRAPRRPNPIGFSVVRLVRIKGSTLTIQGVDMLDGTPLLDIKPYVPEFDHPGSVRLGWLKKLKQRARVKRADSRFGNHIRSH
jgi:tRNA-Thr(GGU) m(6)t(6)A37 methyltransferase TsaA